MAESDAFDFPNLDFGRRTMDVGELEQALVHQLHLHSTNELDKIGVSHPDPQKPGSDFLTTEYRKHRLEAVAWFAGIVPSQLTHTKESHSLFIPAVNVMDRYIASCVDFGEDPCQLFKNMVNIQMACLSLAIRMHAVNTEVDLCVLVKRNGQRGSVQGIEEAEKQIITKLHGALFPESAEIMISILCKYLILERIGEASHLPAPIVDGCMTKRRKTAANTLTKTASDRELLNRRIMKKAAVMLTRIALDLRLLRFKRWKCIAVCCLLSTIDTCTGSSLDMILLEEGLMALMEKLKPGEFTRQELSDLKELLTAGCVVCSGSFHRTLRDSLRRVSSMSCAECKLCTQ